MDNKQKPKLNNNEPERDWYDLPFGPKTITSSTECTGLIPSLPETEDEVEAYKALYDVPKQANKEKDGPGGRA
jgi:hypothetical protein